MYSPMLPSCIFHASKFTEEVSIRESRDYTLLRGAFCVTIELTSSEDQRNQDSWR